MLVLLSIALIFIFIGCYLYITSHFTNKTIQNNMSFDSQQWKDSIFRQQMIVDLEENYLHAGMSQSDIISLLGPPDLEGNIEWEYYLPEGKSDSGDGILFLIFDDNKLFKECSVFKENYSLWD
jgi:hypothetical protein